MFDSTERWMSGLSRTPGKRVYVNSVSRVRIPSFPPNNKYTVHHGVFFVFFIQKIQQISVFSRLILYRYISLCCIFFMVMCMVTIE